MSWGRLDDSFDDDERWLAAALDARGLWTSCLARSLRAQSPEVPQVLVQREAGSDADRLADALVAVGLWVRFEDHWAYADGGFAGWDAIVLSSQERAALDAQRSAAGRASAEARRAKYGSAVPRGARNAPKRSHKGPSDLPNGLTSATERLPNVTEPSPAPSPSPVPEGTSIACKQAHPSSTERSVRRAGAASNPSAEGKRAKDHADRPKASANGRTPRSAPQARPAKSTPADEGMGGSPPPCPRCGDGQVDQLGKFLGCHGCGWVVEGSLASEPATPVAGFYPRDPLSGVE